MLFGVWVPEAAESERHRGTDESGRTGRAKEGRLTHTSGRLKLVSTQSVTRPNLQLSSLLIAALSQTKTQVSEVSSGSKHLKSVSQTQEVTTQAVETKLTSHKQNRLTNIVSYRQPC